MATEITVPQLGESVTEGTIAEWLKQPGDAVAVDEPIAMGARGASMARRACCALWARR